MKKFFVSIALTVFSIPIFVSAQTNGSVYNEHIDTYDVFIQVQENGSLEITESITYDYGQYQKHGIYRDIPTVYRQKLRVKNIDISNVTVTNEAGDTLPFTTKNNEVFHIKIGDPNAYVTREQVYNISYTVSGAINFNETHELISWNAIGNQWDVPIQQAQATVSLNDTLLNSLEEHTCYTGFMGDTNPCEFTPSSFTYTANALSPGEGLTIDLQFQKGTFVQQQFEKYKEIFLYFWPFLIPLSMFLFIFFRWYTRGRDPQGRGTIITQFDSPENLSPLEVGIIIDERVEAHDISAQIVYLATQGYLRIVRKEKEGLFDSSTYFLERTKSSSELKHSHDRKIMARLFKKATPGPAPVGLPREAVEYINIKDLKNTFIQDLAEIQKEAYETVTRKKYFQRNPQHARVTYSLVLFGLLILLTILNSLFLFNTVFLVSFFVSFLLSLIIVQNMGARTQKGVYAREHILGLKQYIDIAEKDRIQFHNAPTKNPQTYEKLLPYAMVFGLEKEWAKQFQDLYLSQNPTWYTSIGTSTFNSITLADGLRGFTTTSTTMFVTKSSGGGGSSSGGFGGGGGGSW